MSNDLKPESEQPTPAALASVSGYTLVYACFFDDGEIIGFTRTAEDACEWASRVAANKKSVRIIKIYEIKNARSV